MAKSTKKTAAKAKSTAPKAKPKAKALPAAPAKKSEPKAAPVYSSTSLLIPGRHLTAEGWKKMMLKPLKKDKK